MATTDPAPTLTQEPPRSNPTGGDQPRGGEGGRGRGPWGPRGRGFRGGRSYCRDRTRGRFQGNVRYIDGIRWPIPGPDETGGWYICVERTVCN